MALDTTLVTGTIYETDGTVLASRTVSFTPVSATAVGFADASLAPQTVVAQTNASGEIGIDDGGFSAGVPLALGKYTMRVMGGLKDRTGTVTIDQNMIDAGTADLEAALGPGPTPEIVTAAQVARDEARQWAGAPQLEHHRRLQYSG